MTMWIVTMDATGARLLSRHGSGLLLEEELSHPRGRLKDHQINSDTPGRVFDRTGHGQHGMGSEHGAHEHEVQVFAKQVADRLNHLRQQHKFDSLMLVAAPHVLGVLREALDKNTARLAERSLSKDLQPMRTDDLWHHLRDHLPPE